MTLYIIIADAIVFVLVSRFRRTAEPDFSSIAGVALPEDEPDLLEVIPTQSGDSSIHKLWLPTNDRLGISAARITFDEKCSTRLQQVARQNIVDMQGDLKVLQDSPAFGPLARRLGITVVDRLVSRAFETYMTYPNATQINEQCERVNEHLEPTRKLPAVEEVTGGMFTFDTLTKIIGRGAYPIASGRPIRRSEDGTWSAHLAVHDPYHAIAWLMSAPSLRESVSRTTRANKFGVELHAHAIDLAINPLIIGSAALGVPIYRLHEMDQNAFFYARGEHPDDTDNYTAGFDDTPAQVAAIQNALQQLPS